MPHCDIGAQAQRSTAHRRPTVPRHGKEERAAAVTECAVQEPVCDTRIRLRLLAQSISVHAQIDRGQRFTRRSNLRFIRKARSAGGRPLQGYRSYASALYGRYVLDPGTKGFDSLGPSARTGAHLCAMRHHRDSPRAQARPARHVHQPSCRATGPVSWAALRAVAGESHATGKSLPANGAS